MSLIRFLSSDLNGTLVRPHTMQEMIRFAFPDEPARFEKARQAFALQTEGRLSMAETFRIAGAQSRGLSLRAAIDYALNDMDFVDGYSDLMESLRRRGIPWAIVSTGYTVTLYVMRYGTPTPPFLARCNRLLFADADQKTIEEGPLERLVREYIRNPPESESETYDSIRATGEVVLGIREEEDKARIALELAAGFRIPPQQVAHVGDTMGDSRGILEVARAGGLGIAFNYNRALEAFLRTEGKREMEAGRIVLVDAKSDRAHLGRLTPFLG